MEHAAAPVSIDRGPGLDTTVAISTALWWAAGTAITVSPVLASLFTVNRSQAFWPLLIAATVAGATVGVLAHRNPSTHLAERLTALPAAMLVALGYPISGGIGLGIENAGSGRDGAATLLYLAFISVVVAFGCLCRWGPWWQPTTALRRSSWLWAALSILLLPLLGLGLFFVPLAVAYRRAAQTVGGSSRS